MHIFSHEWKIEWKTTALWTVILAAFFAICLIIFPSIQEQMADIGSSFENMGGFSEAFGMDSLNIGSFLGYYAIELMNTVGLAGALFAGYMGIQLIVKEEREHTSEYLMTLPVTRKHVWFEKLAVLFSKLTVMHLFIGVLAFVLTRVVGEDFSSALVRLHLAMFLSHVQIGLLCFGIGSLFRRINSGVGIGIAGIFYFLNIMKNLLERLRFIEWITPFAYTEPAEVIQNNGIDWPLVLAGFGVAMFVAWIGFVYYQKKDLDI